jgi:cytoskeletal protein RodZ
MKISRAERDGCSDGFGISRVGARLKAAREESGLTLDEVARVTRIGKNYLEAIEGGDLDRLPSPAYTRGFIRLYAAHLGLSPEEALSLLDANQPGNPEKVSELPSTPQYTRRTIPEYSRKLLLIVCLTFALAAAYFLIKPTVNSRTASQRSQIATQAPEQAVSKTVAPQLQNTPESLSPSSPPQQQTKGQQGLVLRLKAVSDGRIHITIDGSISQEYDLIAGDLVEWKAENLFMLDLDNAASVEGELDGVKLQPFGEQGNTAHLVLKANGVHKE